MKKAWVENEVIRDICQGNPSDSYHPDVAVHYSDDVPDDAANGDWWDGLVLTKPVPPEPVTPEPMPTPAPQLSPVEFKMCFTSAERLAITAIMDNAEHQASPTLKDVYSILDDPRLKIVDLGLQSNLDLIDFLVSLNVLTSDRAAEIKDGVLK